MDNIINKDSKSFNQEEKEIKRLEEKKLISISQKGKLAELKLKEDGPSLSLKERNILKKEIDRGLKAVDEILKKHLRPLRNIANKYIFRLKMLQIDDLIQIGLLSLYKHILTFDLNQNNALLTYAYRGINNEMFKHFKEVNFLFNYDIVDKSFKVTRMLDDPNNDYLFFNSSQYDKVSDNIFFLQRDYFEETNEDQPKGRIVCSCSYTKGDKTTIYNLRSKSLNLIGDKNKSIKFLQSDKDYYHDLYNICFICYLVNKLGYENSFILTHRYALFGNSIEHSISNVGKLINRSERYTNTRLNTIFKQIEDDKRISKYLKNYNEEKYLYIKKDIVLSYFQPKEQKIIRAYSGINSTGTKSLIEDIIEKENISIEEINVLINDFNKKLESLKF